MGADWGKNIQLSIFGESHGKVVGINIGGLPAGIKLDFDYINSQMARPQTGQRRPFHPTQGERRRRDTLRRI